MEDQATYRRNGNGNGYAKTADLSNYVFGKVQPQAIPLEGAVLGALMLERDALMMVADLLTPETFYLNPHQNIYRAIIRLFEAQSPIDLLTVTEQMRKDGTIETVDGGYYLVELSHQVASSANIEYHARILAQKHIQRQLIVAATETIRDAYEDATDAFALLEKTEINLFKIGHRKAKSAQHVRDITTSVIMEAERAMQYTGECIGIPSGIRALDKETGGWRSPDLVIIAGRPAMGKTALALTIAKGSAKAGTGVAFFSLEMSKAQLVQRLVCMEGKVNGQMARNGKLTQDDFRRMCEAQPVVDEMPIYIEDTPAMSVIELRAAARRLKMKHNIGAVIVDYLQLMRGGEDQRGNREREIAQISGGLKALAKELEVPVIALAQLSRAVEVRGGSKRPQMSDLRESGAIENDADIILFPYRPEYYQITEDEEGNSLAGVAELIIGKNRHGRSGISVMCGFDEFYALFRDLDEKPSSQFPATAPQSGASVALPEGASMRGRNEEDIPF